MRTMILSAGFATAMAALAFAPANAAPIATHGVIVAPAAATDVACRTVKKTVVRNGVRRVTTSQECTRGPAYGKRVYVAPRRYTRPAPGLTIRVR